MNRAYKPMVLAFMILHCLMSSAQDRPLDVTFSGLSRHPLKFDGRLVRVQAVLSFGWEGDNFLSDAKPDPEIAPLGQAPSIWFYCKPERERQVYAAIFPRKRVRALFTGYFHFAPVTHIMNGAFDPGPLQLEVVEVSHPAVETQFYVFKY